MPDLTTTTADVLRSLEPERTLTGLLRLRCPSCTHDLRAVDPVAESQTVVCAACGFSLRNLGGIWRALTPAREQHFGLFVSEYECVRRQEGRGSSHSAYYLELPFKDLTGRNSGQWNIRSRSFRCLVGHVFPALGEQVPGPWHVLDIGAGNCWLSYRLARLGHKPVAVDLLDSELDGLGVATRYFAELARPFARFQAEMDRLPFSEGQFPLAIFNASFHYSEDYEVTLREALRCLTRPGHVIILDSPFYDLEESGRRMVAEKHAQFEAQYGFRSDSIPSREYLTKDSTEQLAKASHVEWRIIKPWHGLGWALRPWKARVRGRREPSQFFIHWITAGL